MISIAVWNLPAIVGNCRLRSRDHALQAGFCQDLRLVQPVCPLVPSDARKILLLSCLCGFPGQVRINLSLCLNLCCGYIIHSLTHLLHLQGELQAFMRINGNHLIIDRMMISTAMVLTDPMLMSGLRASWVAASRARNCWSNWYTDGTCMRKLLE